MPMPSAQTYSLQPWKYNRKMSDPNFSPLTSLPWELQLMVLAYLDSIPALLNLRRTCRLYHQYLTPAEVRKLYGQTFSTDLMHVCSECLVYAPHGYGRTFSASASASGPGSSSSSSSSTGGILIDKTRSPAVRWRTSCLRCYRRKTRGPGYYDRHGYVVVFADAGFGAPRPGVLCDLCGWALVPRMDTRWRKLSRYHGRCVWVRNAVWTAYWSVGVLQLCLGMITGVVAWSNYEEVPVVMVPATLGFSIAILYLFLLPFPKITNTWVRIAVESGSVVLWIPCVYYTAAQVADGEAMKLDSFPIFALAMFAAILLFRLINTIGYVLLGLGYDPRDHSLPGLSLGRRVCHVTCFFVVSWAHPELV
ncbi:hypothetical protein F5Y15DRAFT_416771 [Xylariaceae sp. FL0016]|nr:hypothetical protein F5Y15DRAFT_416771 [Xylariaceae sp. FL0016]